MIMKETCSFQIYMQCFFISLITSYVSSGANNIHMIDGTSTADVIARDIFFEITEPPELQYSYRIKPARDFGTPFNESVQLFKRKLVLSEPLYGCDEIKNTELIAGQVALVIRGECSFVYKSARAEEAGAVAVIITEYVEGWDESQDNLIEMVDDTMNFEVHIPSGFLVGRSGATILSTLRRLNRRYAIINLPVNMTHVPTSKMKQPPWINW